MTKNHRRHLAFTLMELLLIVALIGIMVSIAIPRLNHEMISQGQCEATAQHFAGICRLARSWAIGLGGSDNSGIQVTVTLPKGPYQIVKVSDSSTLRGPHPVPNPITISGDTTFHFNRMGTLEDTTSRSATFSDGVTQETVTVSLIGHIKVS